MSESTRIPESVAIPETSDPKVFMEAFFKSDVFLNGLHNPGKPEIPGWNDYLEKTKNAEADLNEKMSVYLDGDNAKQLLLEFDKKDLRLKFDPSKYDEGVLSKLESYMGSVQTALDVLQYPAGSPQENQTAMMSADRNRTVAHNEFAESLKEAGIVPSVRLGRMYARLILIDKHLDTYDGAADEGNPQLMIRYWGGK